MIGAAGTWTGSAWEGLAFPCPSGPVPDELIYDTCAKSVVGLRWDPSTGWSTSEASPTPDDLGAGLHFAGVTSSSEIIITARTGVTGDRQQLVPDPETGELTPLSNGPSMMWSRPLSGLANHHYPYR